MSSLQVANIFFESTANTRFQYDGTGGVNIVAGGTNAITVNSTAIAVANTFTVGGNYVSPLSSGMKNRLINGDMRIWQRGTSGFTTTGNYGPDRWQIAAATSLSTGAQSTDAPTGHKYSLSVSGTNYPQVYQKVEALNCVDLPGQNITISFWAKQTSGAGTGSIVSYIAYANAADNFTGVTAVSSAAFNGSSSWTYYTATFTNLPANIANGFQFVVYCNTTGAASFLMTGAQLEVGTAATPFDRRLYTSELSLCQRYYYTSGPSTAPGILFHAQSTSTTVSFVQHPVRMRTAPTFTSSGTWTWSILGGDTSISSISASSVTDFIAQIETSTSSLPGTGQAGRIRGGIYNFSAEL